MIIYMSSSQICQCDIVIIILIPLSNALRALAVVSCCLARGLACGEAGEAKSLFLPLLLCVDLIILGEYRYTDGPTTIHLLLISRLQQIPPSKIKLSSA